MSSSIAAAALKSLADRLDRLNTTQEKVDAMRSYLDSKDAEPHGYGYLLQGISSESDPLRTAGGEPEFKLMLDLFEKHGISESYLNWALEHLSTERPLERLPCANAVPEKNWRCQENGTMACSGCKLVSYCSKVCQRTHWRAHKSDCKDPIRSVDWEPAWVKERRSPSFMQSAEDGDDWLSALKEKEFALGLDLWGNVPAVDTLNLPQNEGAQAWNTDLALAYVASGDLRNIVRTINELPINYSGHLTIVLNDRQPMVVVRNLLLLIILGTITDTAEAAEVALHFWYSAFVSTSHKTVLARIVNQLAGHLQDGSFNMKLGENSLVTGAISMHTIATLFMSFKSNLLLGDASNEINRVRFEPSRVDRHHRQYCLLEPSHRLASLEFRRFGLVYPFGAANNHFNSANTFLFSDNGRWLEDDMATPLASWNIEDVVAAGKAHGALREDLLGCLYFYLSGQFRSLADRLQKFHITFRVFDRDARALAEDIRSGALGSHGLSKSTHFDRIDVSNIIDPEYVGIANVLADWAPLLNKTNRNATLLGYSMNWVPRQADAQPGEADIKKLTTKLTQMGKLANIRSKPALAFAVMKYYTAIYDNSSAFSKYLMKYDTAGAARKAGVKLKSKHTIVSHRICAPLGAPLNSLPDFPTAESWYLNVQVATNLLSERFVEFSRE